MYREDIAREQLSVRERLSNLGWAVLRACAAGAGMAPFSPPPQAEHAAPMPSAAEWRALQAYVNDPKQHEQSW